MNIYANQKQMKWVNKKAAHSQSTEVINILLAQKQFRWIDFVYARALNRSTTVDAVATAAATYV